MLFIVIPVDKVKNPVFHCFNFPESKGMLRLLFGMGYTLQLEARTYEGKKTIFR